MSVAGIVTAEETPTHPVSPSASGDHDHMTVNHSVDASMTSLGMLLFLSEAIRLYLNMI